MASFNSALESTIVEIQYKASTTDKPVTDIKSTIVEIQYKASTLIGKGLLRHIYNSRNSIQGLNLSESERTDRSTIVEIQYKASTQHNQGNPIISTIVEIQYKASTLIRAYRQHIYNSRNSIQGLNHTEMKIFR